MLRRGGANILLKMRFVGIESLCKKKTTKSNMLARSNIPPTEAKRKKNTFDSTCVLSFGTRTNMKNCRVRFSVSLSLTHTCNDLNAKQPFQSIVRFNAREHDIAPRQTKKKLGKNFFSMTCNQKIKPQQQALVCVSG
jgi:hypothetical protein